MLYRSEWTKFPDNRVLGPFLGLDSEPEAGSAVSTGSLSLWKDQIANSPVTGSPSQCHHHTNGMTADFPLGLPTGLLPCKRLSTLPYLIHTVTL